MNRVAKSGIVSLDLEEFLYTGEIGLIDLKDHLFQGLILREKDFREFVGTEDWGKYKDKPVAIFCSADAIIPTWAYMLIANRLSGIASSIHYGTEAEARADLLRENVRSMDTEPYRDGLIVVKGCGDPAVTVQAYVAVTEVLTPVVKSLMYGEPCSTVPVYKRKVF